MKIAKPLSQISRISRPADRLCTETWAPPGQQAFAGTIQHSAVFWLAVSKLNEPCEFRPRLVIRTSWICRSIELAMASSGQVRRSARDGRANARPSVAPSPLGRLPLAPAPAQESEAVDTPVSNSTERSSFLGMTLGFVSKVRV